MNLKQSMKDVETHKMERWVKERTPQCWTVPERSRSFDSEEDERMYA